MLRFIKSAFLVFTITVLLSTSSFGQNYQTEYTVTMDRPWNHYYSVEMRMADTGGKDHVDLIMPVWIPGSYMIREYPQFVQEEAAFGGGGNPLKFEKITKNKWRVHLKNSKSLTFTYRVFAFTKSIRHSYLDEFRAIINGVHMFIFPEPNLNKPVKVKFVPLKQFKQIATGLQQDKNDKFTVYAEDFDELYDCPVEIGNQDILEFKVKNIPHYISISGGSDYNAEYLIKDTKRIVEEAVKIFGDFPYKKYVFFMGMGVPGGGLEHRNSTYLALGKWGYSTEQGVLNLVGLISHEYFHTWNVKRIRPFALGPFDYSKENYTRLLWVAEGFTVYYGGMINYRAGYTSLDSYLQSIASRIGGYFRNNGRFIQSPEDASFDAWIKYYRRHENSNNTTISYYDFGTMLATLINLTIIHDTDGQKDLDNLMVQLYNEYYLKKKRGFTPEEFQKEVEKLAGKNLDRFFEDHVRGKKEIDFDKYLNYAGLKLAITEEDDSGGYLGAGSYDRGGKVVISSLDGRSAAYEQGLSVRDEIIAINGLRVENSQFLTSRIGALKAGDKVEFLIAREGKIRTVSIILGKKDTRIFRITKVVNPTDLQKRVYKKWLRAEF